MIVSYPFGMSMPSKYDGYGGFNDLVCLESVFCGEIKVGPSQSTTEVFYVEYDYITQMLRFANQRDQRKTKGGIYVRYDIKPHSESGFPSTVICLPKIWHYIHRKIKRKLGPTARVGYADWGWTDYYGYYRNSMGIRFEVGIGARDRFLPESDQHFCDKIYIVTPECYYIFVGTRRKWHILNALKDIPRMQLYYVWLASQHAKKLSVF